MILEDNQKRTGTSAKWKRKGLNTAAGNATVGQGKPRRIGATGQDSG